MIDDTQVVGDAPVGTVVGTLSAQDVDGDALTYSLDDDAGGRFTVDQNTGAIRTTEVYGSADRGNHSVVARVTDAEGLSTTRTFTLTITDTKKGLATGRNGDDTLSAVASDGDGTHMDGKAGNDRLEGGRYDDRLVGNFGDDVLIGGGGADQFRFFGNQIEGRSDTDQVLDLNFGEGDTLVFGDFGAGTFVKSGGVNAFNGGSSAVLDSYGDIVSAAAASDLVTARRGGAESGDLLLSVTDADGQVQTVHVLGGWAQYVMAGGTDGL
jgi:Ca2+-binding RTX toxin-like protein